MKVKLDAINGVSFIPGGGSGSSISTPISLANGGWGLSNARTQVTTNGTITALAVPTAFIEFSNSSGASVLGIVAQTDGTVIHLYNSGASLVIGHQNAGATAANRIIIPSSANMTVPVNSGVVLRYNGGQSRWVFVTSYSLATTSVAGMMSAADKVLVDTISGKLSGSGAYGRVPYYNGTSTLSNDSTFVYDPLNKKFGVSIASPLATGHFVASTQTTLSALASANATLTLFTPLSAPSGYTATQQTPHLNRTSSFTSNENGTGSSYVTGDVIDYKITAYSAGTYSVVSRTTSTTITSDFNNIDLSWNDDALGTLSVEGYVIQRQVNGGGYSDGKDVGLATSTNDDSTGWGAVSVSPTYPDYLANGTTRNYTAYSKSSINGTAVYSSSGTSTTMTDDNSGNAYVILHQVTSGGSTARILDTDSTTFADGTSFNEYSNSPFAAGSTVTPTTYGINSNGTFWTKTYDFYNYDSGSGIYSASVPTTTTDPNDGSLYYVVLDFTGQTSSAKIVRDSTVSESSATSPIYDNGVGGWAGDATVTPTGYYPSAGTFETFTSSLSDKPTVILKSTSADYSRLEFRSDGNVRRSYLEQTSTQNRFSVPDKGVLSYNTTDRVTWNSTGLGFFAATPVAQQGATTDLGVTLSNLGLRVAGTAYPITTSGAVTLGALTAGSIPFAGTAGLISQSNSKLYWDNTNYNLGIGLIPSYITGFFNTASNLALSKTTSQSSNGGGVSGNAVDGNVSTFQHTNNAANEWWKVDLGASYSVATIVMTKRAGFNTRPSNFKVQKANDYAFTSGVTDLATYTSNSAAAITLSITPQNIQYLRIYCTASEYLSFAEVAVYAPVYPTLSVLGMTYVDGNLNVSTNGSVGIGVNPTEKLDVNGNINIPLTTSTVGQIKQNNIISFHTYGTSNLFLGPLSGNFTTTGAGTNTGVGAETLLSLTSGNANAGIGYQALRATTSGLGNTAIGSYALYVNTTGSYNVGIGQNTLHANLLGANNVAIGTSALFTFVPASAVGYNTAIGTNAGYNVTTGTNNVIIGGKTSATGTLTTGTNVVLLGVDTDVATNNLTNAIAIGYGAVVGASNTLMLGGTGSYLVDTILGGTTASAKLHVIKTTEQLRLGYDVSNYVSTTVGSTGGVTLDAVGSGAGFTFNDRVIHTVPERLKGYTVAGLPAGTQGDVAYVTDALLPTYLAVLTGGGAVVTPVFYNGTAWVSY